MNNLNESDKQQLSNMRHSAEHVLTQAMRNLGFKFLMAMGPATDDGFYFDFELVEGSIKEEDFEKIEKEMKRIIALDLPIVEKTLEENEARKLFALNPYKQEWIDEIVAKG